MENIYNILPLTIIIFFIALIIYKIALLICEKKQKKLNKVLDITLNTLMIIPFILTGIWLIYKGITINKILDKIMLIIFGIFLIYLGISKTIWKDNKIGD